jgi:hypothetical protein
MISLLKWAAFAAILGALVAHTSVLTKVFAVVCGLILLAVWLKSAVLRWLKSEGKAPAWDEISLVPPIMPEPPFTGRGAAYSWIGLLNGLFRTPRKATAITTIQWGNPTTSEQNTPRGTQWRRCGGTKRQLTVTRSKRRDLTIRSCAAEMYEDGEGVTRDLETAGRIYKTQLYQASRQCSAREQRVGQPFGRITQRNTSEIICDDNLSPTQSHNYFEKCRPQPRRGVGGWGSKIGAGALEDENRPQSCQRY